MPKPYSNFFAITPSDTVDLDYLHTQRHEAIYVGTVGDVTVVMPTGVTALFKAVPAGTVLDICVRRVNNAGTSASNLLAMGQQ